MLSTGAFAELIDVTTQNFTKFLLARCRKVTNTKRTATLYLDRRFYTFRLFPAIVTNELMQP